MTIAPEMPGALELIAHAAQSGTRVSLGHSDATAAQTRAAIAAGATRHPHLQRHAPAGPARARNRRRGPRPHALYAELICDGIHVAPESVRLLLRAKGEERAILVTDGISATGMPDANYMLGELEVTVKNGRCLLASDLANSVETLAGSVLTMDRAVANLRRFTGATLATAVRLASRNQARMLGLDQLGEIAVGRPANFNLYSAAGELRQTVLLGCVVAMREMHTSLLRFLLEEIGLMAKGMKCPDRHLGLFDVGERAGEMTIVFVQRHERRRLLQPHL